MIMINLRKHNLLIFIACITLTCGCRDIAVPKPKGWFRIDLPDHSYTVMNDSIAKANKLPLSFEYPAYGKLSFEQDRYSEPGWFNINFPPYKAKIYLTYININNDLEELMEQTYKINVKNHIIKADAIEEQVINNPQKNIYGILYDLKGNTATAVQFFVTDSIKHYLRGSLYFASEPNSDSLAPVIGFFREDIIHLIETLKWDDK
jgi:gliding motility-associated lipoprotein GldD